MKKSLVVDSFENLYFSTVNLPERSFGKCLNCHTSLRADDHYCPNCGQKVDRNDLRLKVVFKEFFENYLSFDTRLGRTLIPFFFKPGFLANEFIKGVRINYANPFRLYIFTSLFFFFCLNGVLKDDVDDKPIIEVSGTEMRAFEDLDQETLQQIESKLSTKQIEALNKSGQKNFRDALLQQKPLNLKKVARAIPDSISRELGLDKDSLLAANSSGFSYEENNSDLNVDFDLHKIEPYMDDPNYTNEMLYDSLMQGQTPTFWEELLVRRLIKMQRAGDGQVARFILSNLSLGMFVLIPLFAFFVKLLYWRRNRFYVAHLIHSIYLQSFAFVLFGILLLLQWLKITEGSSFVLSLQLCAILFGVYFVASFRKIYKQRWVKLLFKSFLLIFIYTGLSAFVLILEVIGSFLFY